ncbi:tail fiber domain-containing protein [Salmonella enterica]
MPIDERTPRLDLEKPAQSNTLKNDVQRLRDSLDKLDEKIVMLDPATGKIKEDQIADSVARLNSAGLLREDQIPMGVPTLGPDGRISSKVIPDDAKIHLHDVSSEVLMLDLKATLGDIARITQPPYSRFILTAPDATKRENWREIPDTAVSSVNGQTGSVTVAAAGVNSDITSLTALSGPLSLGGDGQNDYDAVTMRQLKASSGGAAGANMTGIMTNFIGAVEWFNGTRPNYPAGHLPADGQCVDRADAPDLWNAINGGMLLSVTDAEWLSGKLGTVNGAVLNSPGINRGKYSKGGRAGTCPDKTVKGDWFRMPDLNGIQTGSLAGTFLRGSGGQPALTGLVAGNSAPNIKGLFNLHGSEQPNLIAGASGAMAGTNRHDGEYRTLTGAIIPVSKNPATSSYGGVDIDASRSSESYGRQEIYSIGTNGTGIWSANEVRPNSAVGIWLIRANGSFTAPNTEFSVLAGDATTPAANISVVGGKLTAIYQQAGANKITTSLFPAGIQGQANQAWGEWAVRDIGGNKSASARLYSNGDFMIAPNARYAYADSAGNPHSLITMQNAENVIMIGGSVERKIIARCAWNGDATKTGAFEIRATRDPDALDTSDPLWGVLRSGDHSANRWFPASVGQSPRGTWLDGGVHVSNLKIGPGVGPYSRFLHRREVGVVDEAVITASNGTTFSDFKFASSGFATASGTWNGGSDERHKSDIQVVQNALDAVCGWRGVTYLRKDGPDTREVGLIAQDVEKACPEAVSERHRKFNDGEVIEDFKYLNTAGAAAAFHTEAIKELKGIIDTLTERVAELEAKLES